MSNYERFMQAGEHNFEKEKRMTNLMWHTIHIFHYLDSDCEYIF